MRPSSGVDWSVTTIKQGQRALHKVEPIAIRATPKTKLVPEVAVDQEMLGSVLALKSSQDTITHPREHAIVTERLVGGVVAIPVWEYILDAGL